jgi:hypothetical protein
MISHRPSSPSDHGPILAHSRLTLVFAFFLFQHEREYVATGHGMDSRPCPNRRLLCTYGIGSEALSQGLVTGSV